MQAKFDGQLVRVPGYIVPLEDFQAQTSRFLLVPYVGACIHSPPPPPNQIVAVVMVDGPVDFEMWEAYWISLHFSPRGEAKWVRGPPGRGARRLARAGVLDGTLSTASKRNEVLAVVWRASTVGW